MSEIRDGGPFYHGMKAKLVPWDLLTAGFPSNYRPEVIMNRIYFTALPDGAGLAAQIVAIDGSPHVYEVEPTGDFEDDPNVTDKKFPGNPTRSYRSSSPLKVVREIHEWKRISDEELQGWRERIVRITYSARGEIIN